VSILIAIGVLSHFSSDGVGIHRLGMAWATSERSARLSGKEGGFITSWLPQQRIEEWSKYHREALVRTKHLVHRNYRFDQIPCPSSEAQFVEQQFFKVQVGRAETAFSTSGKSSAGDVYEVNLWCRPEQAAFWDSWFLKHNDTSFVLQGMRMQ